MRIKFLTPKTIYTKFPWMFFPDFVLHIYVLQPLIEMLLLRKGYMLVHAGAVSGEGKAYLIAGRGGSHKTNFVMGLMKRGYNYISDDMVILNEKEVLSFPHSVSLFDFSCSIILILKIHNVLHKFLFCVVVKPCKICFCSF